VRSGTALLAATGLRGRRKGGLLATFLVLLLAAVAMSAGVVVSRQGAPLLDAAAADASVAHLVLSGDPEALRAVAADPEVRAWSGPFPTLDDIELAVGEEVVPLQVTALDSPDVTVGRPLPRAGRWAESADEVVLDRSLAADLGIDVGDVVVLRRNGAEVPFTVSGTAVNLTDCFYPQCDPGRMWVTSAGFERFDAGDHAFAQAWLRFDEAGEADPFVQRQAATGIEGITGTESWLDTRSDFLTLDRVFGSFVAAFGVFVLAVAAVVVAGSTAMRVVSRRREIGLLGAIGSTPGQVTGGLLLENLAVGAAAALAGWLLAGFLAPPLQLGIGRTLGPQDPSWSPLGLVVTVAVISLLLTLATVVPAVSAARRPVTDVLRDVPRHRTTRLSRRIARLPRRLSWLGAQEEAGQPARALLASLAIAVAVTGTLVSVGFVQAVQHVAAEPAAAGDPWDLALVPGDRSPDEVADVLRELPGIGTWYAEAPRRSTLDDGAFLSIATLGSPGPEGFQIAGGRDLQAPDEAIAGYGFLKRFGYSVGDEVQILVGTTPVALRIVGWYRVTEDSGEVLRYDFESLAAGDPTATPDVYRLRLAPGADASAVAAGLLDALGRQARVETLDTGTEDLAPLMAVLRLVAVVLLLMAGTNLLSTMLTAARESSGRIGVELAMGFTPRQLTAQGAAAGTLLGALACLVGVPLGLWLFRQLSDAVSTGIGVGPGWMPAPGWGEVALIAALAVIASAGLASIGVRRTAAKPASDLLRAE
jgi:putative ABC transport system permease protein